MSSLICPVSPDKIDKNAGRIGAVLTAGLLGAYAYTGMLAFLVLVVIDYVLRVFVGKARPPIAYVARVVAKGLGLGKKPMNKGPKVFAWRVGFLFALAAFLLAFLSPYASVVVAIALLGFNLLDGVLNFCLGCVVYTYVILPLMNAQPQTRDSGAS